MQAIQAFLRLTEFQRQRTILRSDSGFGADYNLDYGLDEDWQVLSKGYGGRRSASLAKKVAQAKWLELGNQRWVTTAVDPPTYLRPVQQLILRWQTEKGEIKHSHIICSILEWSMQQVIEQYDDRGSCETQIQADKGGLKMEKRRKQRLAAQEALILLTDLAHNTLSWASGWMSPEGLWRGYGTTRLIEDVFRISGRLIFEEDRLIEVHLNQRHPLAKQVAAGLELLLAHFDHP